MMAITFTMPRPEGLDVRGPGVISCPPKRAGCCVCCGEPVYEVLAWHTEGPLEGHPRRVGPMLDHGTQLEFLMSNGTEADIACCTPCADALTPEHYMAIWECVVDRADFGYQRSGAAANERRTTLASMMRLWPVALLRRRRENQVTGGLVVDPRTPEDHLATRRTPDDGDA